MKQSKACHSGSLQPLTVGFRHRNWRSVVIALVTFGAVLEGNVAWANPCAGIEGDAEYLRKRIEATVVTMESALYFQRAETAAAQEFQNQCEGQEDKSAECRALGIRNEALRSLRKEKETLVQEITQELTFYRQEYQNANLSVFRCRKANAGNALPDPGQAAALEEDPQQKLEREKFFQPPKAELPPYEPDVDLRPPNALGDPSVRGPRRSREPGNAERIVPTNLVPPASDQAKEELPPERIVELPPGFPALETMTPETIERLKTALRAQPAPGSAERITELPPGLPQLSDMSPEDIESLRTALRALPPPDPATLAERITELPPGFPALDTMSPDSIDKLRTALEALPPPGSDAPPERITALPPGLPQLSDMTPEDIDKLRTALGALPPPGSDASIERITELPPGLPSPDKMSPEDVERLRTALGALPPPGSDLSATRITELPPGFPSLDSMSHEDLERLRTALGTLLPPGSEVETKIVPSLPGEGPNICSTTSEGDYKCQLTQTDADGSFDVSSPGMPTYSFLMVQPGGASVFMNLQGENMALPGLYLLSDSETQRCWDNQDTGAKICIQK